MFSDKYRGHVENVTMLKPHSMMKPRELPRCANPMTESTNVDPARKEQA
jgi:hypothetical protein